jgi:hypothetical protein
MIDAVRRWAQGCFSAEWSPIPGYFVTSRVSRELVELVYLGPREVGDLVGSRVWKVLGTRCAEAEDGALPSRRVDRPSNAVGIFIAGDRLGDLLELGGLVLRVIYQYRGQQRLRGEGGRLFVAWAAVEASSDPRLY